MVRRTAVGTAAAAIDRIEDGIVTAMLTGDAEGSARAVAEGAGIVMVAGLFEFANMWVAVFADTGVSVLCLLDSIRILYRK